MNFQNLGYEDDFSRGEFCLRAEFDDINFVSRHEKGHALSKYFEGKK